jgi:hypothetical protein
MYFNKTISFDKLIELHVRWATVDLEAALEYSFDKLDVLLAKSAKISSIYNRLEYDIYLLGYAYGDDDFLREAKKRPDMKEFRTRVVEAVEKLSEKIARRQLEELNKTNDRTGLARRLVARFDDEEQG